MPATRRPRNKAHEPIAEMMAILLAHSFFGFFNFAERHPGLARGASILVATKTHAVFYRAESSEEAEHLQRQDHTQLASAGKRVWRYSSTPRKTYLVRHPHAIIHMYSSMRGQWQHRLVTASQHIAQSAYKQRQDEQRRTWAHSILLIHQQTSCGVALKGRPRSLTVAVHLVPSAAPPERDAVDPCQPITRITNAKRITDWQASVPARSCV